MVRYLIISHDELPIKKFFLKIYYFQKQNVHFNRFHNKYMLIIAYI